MGMSMNVTVYGCGYVGLVTAACLAHMGNKVVCVDIDAERIAQLSRGECPLYEVELPELLAQGQREGLLRFTADAKEGVRHGVIQFIAVGTPSLDCGEADTRAVMAVADTIGRHLKRYAVIVSKSTVPVGTAEAIARQIRGGQADSGRQQGFDVVSNPEFLKEGVAVADFQKPDRIIIGCESARAEALMRELYSPFSRNRNRLHMMDIRSAELTKYAANAMLAARISFMNEIANVAERLGADVDQVRRGIGSDLRIGPHFLYPGCGFGGSCFPKDLAALIRQSHDRDYNPQMLQAISNVNVRQRQRLFVKVRDYFEDDLEGRTFALWGLAFKPGTDDMRDAPSRDLMESLWSRGAKVRAYDPEAMDRCRDLYGDANGLLELVDNKEAALDGADALIVCTEWKSFLVSDFELIANSLREPVIVDGRNLWEPAAVAAYGINYLAIGREARPPNLKVVAA